MSRQLALWFKPEATACMEEASLLHSLPLHLQKLPSVVEAVQWKGQILFLAG